MYHVSVGRGRCARQIPSASHSLGTSPCFKGRLAARKSLRALRIRREFACPRGRETRPLQFRGAKLPDEKIFS